MFVLALVVILATGETALLSYAPGDTVKLFETKAACQEVLAKKFDEMVKAEPTTNFMFACVSPSQYEATRKRLEDRAKKTTYL
ncbi:MAG TPA: hypothetical protein PKV98_04215 [Burkholderiaceae bacterium]|nr:hypothetical protein [Burkholderiaceae bacterium]